MVAISEECFEGFLAGILVKQALPFFGIQAGGAQLVASFAELREPFFIFGAELTFELLSEALRESRALPGGRDGDLQVASLHDRGIVEIT